MSFDFTNGRPSTLAMARDPSLMFAWRDFTRAWEEANAELAAAWDDALAEVDARRRAWEARQAAEARLKASGLPARNLDEWRFGLGNTPATEAVDTFLSSGKTFLLLLGRAGVGKTTACARALENGGLFRRTVELSRLSSFDSEHRRQFEQACQTRTLVLDDLGAEHLHDGWRPLLDELIDIRYGNRLRTLITTNLDGQGFKAKYGERIVDRIRHDGLVGRCGDKSLRGPA